MLFCPYNRLEQDIVMYEYAYLSFIDSCRVLDPGTRASIWSYDMLPTEVFNATNDV